VNHSTQKHNVREANMYNVTVAAIYLREVEYQPILIYIDCFLVA